jgi:glycosyltransferase involved in cell wall biosynthesis
MDKLVFGALPVIAKGEIRGLRRMGVNASLLLIKRGIELQDREMDAVLTEVLEDQSSLLSKMGLKIPGFSFFSAFHILAPLVATGFNLCYDLLISHGTYTCFTAYSLKKTRDIPYVAYIYDPITYILRKVYSDESLRHLFPVLLPLGRKLDRLIVNSSEAVILLSKYHLSYFREVTDKPIHIVYPGTEVAERIPSERGGYLLAVARWEREKRPFFLLDVLKSLRRGGLRPNLLVEGAWKSPALRAEFLKQIRQDRLDEQVKLCGPSDRPTLMGLYVQARALIVPNTEAFGMIALEAAAHGAPIIVPKRAGVTDLFSHGVHGFFPDEGDIVAFTEYVKRLIVNERAAWKMGYQAWEVAKNYTWDNHANSLLAVLRDLM